MVMFRVWFRVRNFAARCSREREGKPFSLEGGEGPVRQEAHLLFVVPNFLALDVKCGMTSV